MKANKPSTVNPSTLQGTPLNLTLPGTAHTVVELHPWEMKDAEQLYNIAKKPLPHISWEPHKSVEESEMVIKNIFIPLNSYAITISNPNQKPKIVGNISLWPGGKWLNLQTGEAEVGFWVARQYWGENVATRALHSLIVHTFTQTDITTLYATHRENNVASRKVQEKNGFSYYATVDGNNVKQVKPLDPLTIFQPNQLSHIYVLKKNSTAVGNRLRG